MYRIRPSRTPVPDVCCSTGISAAKFYNWKKK
jgi:hypothetical protein